jgi:predicted ATPase
MKSLRVKNLRSIGDSGHVAIKPITLLIGRNGSGKSSFLRLLPLLRQSAESRTRGPLLWFGEYIDFGSFANTVRTNIEKKEIALELSFDIVLDGRISRSISRGVKIESTILITFRSDTKDEKTYISALILKLNSDVITLDMDTSGEITHFKVNDTLFEMNAFPGKLYTSNTLIPNIIFTNDIDKTRQFGRMRFLNPYHFYDIFPFTHPFFALFNDKSRLLFSRKVSDTTIKNFFSSIRYTDKGEFLKQLKQIKIGGKVFQENISHLDSLTPEITEIRNVHLGILAPIFFQILDEYMSRTAHQIHYIGPVRATAQRFYRIQELAVDRIDYKGQNLAEFLRSLTETERAKFKRWTSENLSFDVFTRKQGEHIELKLIETGSKSEYNLADTGFGFSQVLPIAAQLWSIIERFKIPESHIPILFSIEQPELHLHPNYQARVADMMIAAVNKARESKLDARLIIETHSETIVNRIGNQISSGKIAKDDVNVVLFEKAYPDQETIVRTSYFDENGYLVNWPYGFFDPEQG